MSLHLVKLLSFGLVDVASNSTILRRQITIPMSVDGNLWRVGNT